MTGPALFLTKNMTGIDFFLASLHFTSLWQGPLEGAQLFENRDPVPHTGPS